MQGPLLRVRGVTKRYKNVLANEDIRLDVQRGEVFGLLGPNGAGKSTLVRQILGLTQPTAGTIEVAGINVQRYPMHAKRVCSYQPQSGAYFDGLTPRQALRLVAEVRGAKPSTISGRADALIEVFNLEAWADTLASRLSGGVSRLFSFCLATIVPGQLVILDEPTNDVDPIRRTILWNEVRRLGRSGISVLLVTHNVLEAERVVDTVAILDQGSVVKAGSLSALQDSPHGALFLELYTGDEIPSLPRFVQLVEGEAAPRARLVLTIGEGREADSMRWAQKEWRRGRVLAFALTRPGLGAAYERAVTE